MRKESVNIFILMIFFIFLINLISASCIEKDNGLNYYQKSKISGIMKISGTFDKQVDKQDYCIDANKLTEFYCEKDKIKYSIHNCLNSEECKDGKCMTVTEKVTKEKNLLLKELGDFFSLKWVFQASTSIYMGEGLTEWKKTGESCTLGSYIDNNGNPVISISAYGYGDDGICGPCLTCATNPADHNKGICLASAENSQDARCNSERYRCDGNLIIKEVQNNKCGKNGDCAWVKSTTNPVDCSKLVDTNKDPCYVGICSDSINGAKCEKQTLSTQICKDKTDPIKTFIINTLEKWGMLGIYGNYVWDSNGYDSIYATAYGKKYKFVNGVLIPIENIIIGCTNNDICIKQFGQCSYCNLITNKCAFNAKGKVPNCLINGINQNGFDGCCNGQDKCEICTGCTKDSDCPTCQYCNTKTMTCRPLTDSTFKFLNGKAFYNVVGGKTFVSKNINGQNGICCQYTDKFSLSIINWFAIANPTLPNSAESSQCPGCTSGKCSCTECGPAENGVAARNCPEGKRCVNGKCQGCAKDSDCPGQICIDNKCSVRECEIYPWWTLGLFDKKCQGAGEICDSTYRCRISLLNVNSDSKCGSGFKADDQGNCEKCNDNENCNYEINNNGEDTGGNNKNSCTPTYVYSPWCTACHDPSNFYTFLKQSYDINDIDLLNTESLLKNIPNIDVYPQGCSQSGTCKVMIPENIEEINRLLAPKLKQGVNDVIAIDTEKEINSITKSMVSSYPTILINNKNIENNYAEIGNILKNDCNPITELSSSSLLNSLKNTLSNEVISTGKVISPGSTTTTCPTGQCPADCNNCNSCKEDQTYNKETHVCECILKDQKVFYDILPILTQDPYTGLDVTMPEGICDCIDKNSVKNPLNGNNCECKDPNAIIIQSTDPDSGKKYGKCVCPKPFEMNNLGQCVCGNGKVKKGNDCFCSNGQSGDCKVEITKNICSLPGIKLPNAPAGLVCPSSDRPFVQSCSMYHPDPCNTGIVLHLSCGEWNPMDGGTVPLKCGECQPITKCVAGKGIITVNTYCKLVGEYATCVEGDGILTNDCYGECGTCMPPKTEESCYNTDSLGTNPNEYTFPPGTNPVCRPNIDNSCGEGLVTENSKIQSSCCPNCNIQSENKCKIINSGIISSGSGSLSSITGNAISGYDTQSSGSTGTENQEAKCVREIIKECANGLKIPRGEQCNIPIDFLNKLSKTKKVNCDQLKTNIQDKIDLGKYFDNQNVVGSYQIKIQLESSYNNADYTKKYNICKSLSDALIIAQESWKTSDCYISSFPVALTTTTIPGSTIPPYRGYSGSINIADIFSLIEKCASQINNREIGSNPSIRSIPEVNSQEWKESIQIWTSLFNYYQNEIQKIKDSYAGSSDHTIPEDKQNIIKGYLQSCDQYLRNIEAWCFENSKSPIDNTPNVQLRKDSKGNLPQIDIPALLALHSNIFLQSKSLSDTINPNPQQNLNNYLKYNYLADYVSNRQQNPSNTKPEVMDIRFKNSQIKIMEMMLFGLENSRNGENSFFDRVSTANIKPWDSSLVKAVKYCNYGVNKNKYSQEFWKWLSGCAPDPTDIRNNHEKNLERLDVYEQGIGAVIYMMEEGEYSLRELMNEMDGNKDCNDAMFDKLKAVIDKKKIILGDEDINDLKKIACSVCQSLILDDFARLNRFGYRKSADGQTWGPDLTTFGFLSGVVTLNPSTGQYEISRSPDMPYSMQTTAQQIDILIAQNSFTMSSGITAAAGIALLGTGAIVNIAKTGFVISGGYMNAAATAGIAVASIGGYSVAGSAITSPNALGPEGQVVIDLASTFLIGLGSLKLIQPIKAISMDLVQRSGSTANTNPLGRVVWDISDVAIAKADINKNIIPNIIAKGGTIKELSAPEANSALYEVTVNYNGQRTTFQWELVQRALGQNDGVPLLESDKNALTSLCLKPQIPCTQLSAGAEMVPVVQCTKDASGQLVPAMAYSQSSGRVTPSIGCAKSPSGGNYVPVSEGSKRSCVPDPFNSKLSTSPMPDSTSRSNRNGYVGLSDPSELPNIGEFLKNAYDDGRDSINPVQAEALNVISEDTKNAIINQEGEAENFVSYNSNGELQGTISIFKSKLAQIGKVQYEIGRIASSISKECPMSPKDFFKLIDSMIRNLEAKGVKNSICVTNIKDARAYRTIFKGKNGNSLLRDNPQFCKDNNIVKRTRAELSPDELAEVIKNKICDDDLWYKKIVKNGKTYYIQYQVTLINLDDVRPILDSRLK